MDRTNPLSRFLPWHYFMRLRYRLGYGVQSPSRYYFVRHVMYQRLPYYAYSSLPRVNSSSTTARLLFRLANYTQAKEVVIYSDSQTNKGKAHTEVLKSVFYAGCHSSIISVVSLSSVSYSGPMSSSENISELDQEKKVKCLYYVDELQWTDDLLQKLIKILQQAPTGTLLDIEGIYSSKEYYYRWLTFIQKFRNLGISFVAYEMNKRGVLLLDNNSFSKVFII